MLKNFGNVYKYSLSCYLKDWLSTYSIDFDAIEGEGRLFRTKNIYEQYNRRMKQRIGIIHSRLTILIKRRSIN